jgi:hypothetical protein
MEAMMSELFQHDKGQRLAERAAGPACRGAPAGRVVMKGDATYAW